MLNNSTSSSLDKKGPAGSDTKNQETPRMKGSPKPSPRTPQTLNFPTKTTQSSPKTGKQKQIDIMELPARLGADSGSGLNLKITPSTGDRVRGGGGGDSSIRLPLECLSKEEIKNEMKDNRLSYHQLADPDEDQNLEEQEEEVYDETKMTTVLSPDRARFNTWNGVNYDLPVLGDFKSDFERRVKSFQRPETNSITMDPFCRSESGLTDEPSRGDAFLVWKSSKSTELLKQHCSSDNITASMSSLIINTSEDEDDDAKESDTDSLPDPEIKDYMRHQREKTKHGLSATGETPYYDDEFGVIRNLHKESHSLTSYGMAPDHMYIGKARLFYPEMSEAEKKMLTAVMSQNENFPNSRSGSPRIPV